MTTYRFSFLHEGYPLTFVSAFDAQRWPVCARGERIVVDVSAGDIAVAIAEIERGLHEYLGYVPALAKLHCDCVVAR